ncbi:MAG TPA: hypothetical protein DEB47_22640 [Citreicella sp.]|nr:hypothetical protein [Citreicella sp.]
MCFEIPGALLSGGKRRKAIIAHMGRGVGRVFFAKKGCKPAKLFLQFGLLIAATFGPFVMFITGQTVKNPVAHDFAPHRRSIH